jgi:hypothetical protein
MKKTLIAALFIGFVMLPCASLARGAAADYGIAEGESYQFTVGMRIELDLSDQIYSDIDTQVDDGSGLDGMDSEAVLTAVLDELNSALYHINVDVDSIDTVDGSAGYPDITTVTCTLEAKYYEDTTYQDIGDFLDGEDDKYVDAVLAALDGTDYADELDQAWSDYEPDYPSGMGDDLMICAYATGIDMPTGMDFTSVGLFWHGSAIPLFIPTNVDFAADWETAQEVLDAQLANMSAADPDAGIPESVQDALDYAGVDTVEVNEKEITIQWNVADMDQDILDMIESEMSDAADELGVTVSDPGAATMLHILWDENGVLQNFRVESAITLTVDDESYGANVKLDISAGENTDIDAVYAGGLQVPGYPLEILSLVAAFSVALLILKTKRQ